ncbi:hypothetical protein A3A93_00260 [Candidatus Roizmanbacteria bacterium RIFCSPLOWO2_01_FULL_38_12]|uniref:DNA-binding response regulator n=1 Tax=Candidatus Roizmanbacteria bacterium RIFCSPLOWO2_01_FULL_38_12 TaxID=1802061 RepID=A0A1F7IUD8_9BACT|nr:MAG: hypothetical protein A2861_00900 [Candidatus Roizmanbacteria bacterium RIFCSPHIGHO2_01_FULL_38_15]OGK34700.1 MAG: hypothetical protein A3F59_01080 [Candidatus Roizmanbacteria bacterium RIFCSPHIGHO2_12_FULL_38_13]OGK46974.1 MAG: hypothetical protein A3A93_00260 [Candidatus Roizmanbacteria bacterium RIFCSPLOWO2_01_FULL_38_12]
MVASILIIEDDEGVLTYLKEFLFEHGYNVMTATAGAKGLAIIKKTAPDLVILDLGLPDTSGETLCRQIREKFSDIQIIMLTAKDTPQDIIQGLKLGADDYLTKPFDAEVLLARIQARLRRKTGTNANLQVGDLKLDTQTMQVTRAKKELHLTAQEYKLLEYLMQNMGKVLTRDMILNRLWLSSVDIETRIVDVYVGYLRKKIDRAFPKKLIRSVRGFGYTIKE